MTDLDLTTSQAQHLEALIACDGLRGGNILDSYNGVGMTVVLDRLVARGLASASGWDGTVHTYRATADGAAALAAHD